MSKIEHVGRRRVRRAKRGPSCNQNPYQREKSLMMGADGTDDEQTRPPWLCCAAAALLVQESRGISRHEFVPYFAMLNLFLVCNLRWLGCAEAIAATQERSPPPFLLLDRISFFILGAVYPLPLPPHTSSPRLRFGAFVIRITAPANFGRFRDPHSSSHQSVRT